MIELRGVTKRYGRFPALKKLDLSVARGEIFGLLGPNGAGKSTTVKILCGLVRPSSGHAKVGGFDVVSDRSKLKRLVGYLPERVPVYKAMTAREYLRFFERVNGLPRKRGEDRVERYLKMVNLDQVDGRAVGQFSKGMVQRLGIARALLSEPHVLFLDEPASGLDPTGRREIRALVRELGRQGRTVLLCSHDLAEVQATCTRVGFLRKGELVHVQRVGEAAGSDRRFKVELSGPVAKAAQALRSLPGVRNVKADGQALRVRTSPAVTRAALAHAVQKAGSIHLGVHEITSDLERLYRKLIEGEDDEEGNG